MNYFISVFVVFGAAFAACQVSPVLSLSTEEPAEFDVAKIVLEQNVTDDDAEIVVTAKGLDEGLKSVRVVNPRGVTILDVTAGASTLGVRELAVESPEPGLSKVLKAYPEGVYRIEGTSFSGVRLKSTARLSHRLPEAPGVEVDLGKGEIRWKPGGETIYLVELEREVNDVDEQTLTMQLPPGTASFRIPDAFRIAGEYQVGIAAVGKHGNVTVEEKAYSIAK